MNPSENSSAEPGAGLSRREVLRRMVTGSVAIAAAASIPTARAQSTKPPAAAEPFVPENNYPFFGFEPELG